MKKTFKTYLFNFTAPLHISDVRQDYGSSGKMIHSDTVYAAVISVLARTGNLPIEVEKTGDLGCTISSLFPFSKLNEEVFYFFPRPMKQVRFDLGENQQEKKLKKARWLERKVFESVINSNVNSLFDISGIVIQGEYICSHEVKNCPQMYSQTIPRASVARSPDENDGDTRIFYMERILFEKSSGLFLLAEGDTTLFEKGLQLLQHEGIGTDRNIGQGTFDLEPGQEVVLDLPENTEYSTTVGLVYPSDTHLSSLTESEKPVGSSITRWDLIERGGWITTDGFNGIRKMSVFMFTEGSLLYTGKSGTQTIGVVDIDLKPSNDEPGLILPDHPVWRCGRSIVIPVAH